MLWGTRGVGKSSIVRQVAEHFGVPLVDLRLTTIEPVDIRGAIYADDVQGKTVWFPPEFLPTPDAARRHPVPRRADRRRPAAADLGLLADPRPARRQLPAARRLAGDRRRQRELPRRGEPRHGHRAGRPHVPLQRADGRSTPSSSTRWPTDFAPEVMAYLKVRPDQLDDTQAQLANDHLVGASPRGWEDISNVLKSGLSEAAQARCSCRAASARPTRPSSSACCASCRPASTWCELLAAQPGAETAALLPRTLDGLYGMVYGLLAAGDRRADAGARAGDRRAVARHRAARRRCRCARRRRWRWSC